MEVDKKNLLSNVYKDIHIHQKIKEIVGENNFTEVFKKFILHCAHLNINNYTADGSLKEI